MKIVILDAQTLGSDIDFSGFDIFGECTVHNMTLLDERFERANGAEVVITNKVLIDKEFIDNCKSVKLVCIAATGMNNVDLEYAKQKGVIVKNVANYSTDSVVQHTFALAFGLLNKLPYYAQYVSSKEWTRSKIFTHIGPSIVEIVGKRWGIIGFGTIGKRVAQIAKVFGADVCYYSTSGLNNEDPEFESKSLEEILSQSDIVSIHAPLNDRTHNLLDANALSLLKKDAVLLNLGRGGIVNELSLAIAIEEKRIYAGLDVLEYEPMRTNCPLINVLKSDRLIITPHVAWASVEARKRLVDKIIEHIEFYVSEK